MEKDLQERINEYIKVNSVKLVQKEPAAPKQQKEPKKKAEKKEKPKEEPKKEVAAENPTPAEAAPSTTESKVISVYVIDLQEQNVNPWSVDAGEEGVDYDKLIRTFGSSPITPV